LILCAIILTNLSDSADSALAWVGSCCKSFFLFLEVKGPLGLDFFLAFVTLLPVDRVGFFLDCKDYDLEPFFWLVTLGLLPAVNFLGDFPPDSLMFFNTT